jgi:uncharacterized protein (TIGR02246 family)
MILRSIFLAVAAMLWVGVVSAADAESGRADQQAIAAVSDQWVQAFRARDVDGLLSLYVADARVMSQDKAGLAGKEEIRQLFAELLGGETLPAINFEIEEIGLMGDFAWASVLAAIVGTDPDGATPYLSRTFIVYRRDLDGTWKIFRDIDHATPDAGRVPLP